ncbi:MAG: hypothetical protein KatS3mg011_0244 [Acidimicrobiia bacterium]|nr:MAG: hypothetical protein KatS3mg011_0244 [Acidimicrobiia bacterium]
MQIRTTPEAGTYRIDPTHTTVGFTVRHLMVAKVRGTFRKVDFTVEVQEPIEDSRVVATIDAASIDTGVEDRDDHLRSPDFLDVANHPNLEFRSTRIRRLDDTHLEVEGELTIRDVTRPVTLQVEVHGVTRDPWGNERIGFTATTTLDREDWGLTWNQPLETGGWLVGKEVQVEIEGEAVRA